MTPPAIELVDVCRTYPGVPPVDALVDVDLTIETGEMVSIVGPSGSGKSTLLNIMGTLDRPTSGSVFVDGIGTDDLNDRGLCSLRATHLGFVFQGFHLIESASVVDNVMSGLLYRGVGRRERLKAATQALARVGLADRAGSSPPKLSGGQRQRVAIARAIVGSPSLLLADEPTGNLDSSTSDEILALLSDLNTTHGATIAIITHDPSVAARSARQIQVYDGRVGPEATVVADNRSGEVPV